MRHGECPEMLPGFVPLACCQGIAWEQGRAVGFKPGVYGQTVTEAKESFEEWIAGMLQSVHRQGYRAPEIRRVYIPKPGKQEMRPLGVPTVADRALQRSTAQVLSAIYEQDFMSCSF